MSQSKVKRITFCLEPILRDALEEAVEPREISAYIRNLLINDLYARGYINDDDLREALL